MANVHKAKQVPEFKKELVNKLADLIKTCSIIGLVNMENLPAAQLQRMKSRLRGKVEMFMAKKRLMKLAIDKAKADKPGIEKIEEHFRGMPALLFTDENPFKLFRMLKKSKTKAPAKAGQTAPADIIVKLAKIILDRVKYNVQDGDSIKRLCEELSWVDETWIEKNE